MKQKWTELKWKIGSSTIIVGDLNTPLSAIDTKTRERINKEIEEVNNTINQLGLTYMKYATQPQQNTHFSQVHMGHSPK